MKNFERRDVSSVSLKTNQIFTLVETFIYRMPFSIPLNQSVPLISANIFDFCHIMRISIPISFRLLNLPLVYRILMFWLHLISILCVWGWGWFINYRLISDSYGICQSLQRRYSAHCNPKCRAENQLHRLQCIDSACLYQFDRILLGYDWHIAVCFLMVAFSSEMCDIFCIKHFHHLINPVTVPNSIWNSHFLIFCAGK